MTVARYVAGGGANWVVDDADASPHPSCVNAEAVVPKPAVGTPPTVTVGPFDMPGCPAPYAFYTLQRYPVKPCDDPYACPMPTGDAFYGFFIHALPKGYSGPVSEKMWTNPPSWTLFPQETVDYDTRFPQYLNAGTRYTAMQVPLGSCP